MTTKMLDRAPTVIDDPEFVAADEAMRQANRAADELDAQLAEARRARQGPDALGRFEAEERESALAAARPRVRATALAAREARASAHRRAFEPVAAYWRARIDEKATRAFGELDSWRAGAYAELCAEIDAARDAGIPAGTMPLAELRLAVAFGRTGGEVYVERARETLKKTGWLTS